jgi:signal transduction histidine kinase
MAEGRVSAIGRSQDSSGAEIPAQAARPRRSGPSWKLVAVVAWLGFSIALAIWWMIFGLQQIDRIAEIGGSAPPAIANEIARQHRMLMSEGATLILLLLIGGAALLYYINKEIRRSQKLREFFAAFTHDLKTSLASLRLQAESLEEDMKDSGHSKIMKRLVKDTVRLELQLENALLVASPDDSSRFLFESVAVAELFKSMSHHWPDLEIEIGGDAVVWGDQRALESIFKNVLQNSVVHGRASRVAVSIQSHDGKVTVRVTDNGRGFDGNPDNLGRMFARHSTSSGSGLGLYLASRLASTMKGELHFRQVSEGFSVEVSLAASEASARQAGEAR